MWVTVYGLRGDVEPLLHGTEKRNTSLACDNLLEQDDILRLKRIRIGLELTDLVFEPRSSGVGGDKYACVELFNFD